MSSAEHKTEWFENAGTSGSGVAQVLSASMDAEEGFESIELNDDELMDRWTVYHLISDALRDPSAVKPVSVQFAARMSAALAREGAHGQLASKPKPKSAPVSRWRQAVLAWPGMAVAAAVASVVWVAQPLFELGSGGQQALSVNQSAPDSAATIAAQSVEPASDYVSAHRQMAGPIAVRQVAFTPGVD